MNIYYAQWKDPYGDTFQSAILTCVSKAQVKRAVKEAYSGAYTIKVRELDAKKTPKD